MAIIGWLLFVGIFYECGFSATHVFLQTLPVCTKNLFALRSPIMMCALFPVSLIFCNLIPRGYFSYYSACLMMQLGSLITWGLWAIAFVFLPVSWWYFAALCVITFVYNFFIPKEMEDSIKSIGDPIFPPRCYFPENMYK